PRPAVLRERQGALSGPLRARRPCFDRELGRNHSPAVGGELRQCGTDKEALPRPPPVLLWTAVQRSGALRRLRNPRGRTGREGWRDAPVTGHSGVNTGRWQGQPRLQHGRLRASDRTTGTQTGGESGSTYAD